MIRSILPRLLLRLCVALAALAPAVGFGATTPSEGWQAVLVAGDNAQPVFDNGVEAMARWLLLHGVPAGDIHRLSAKAAPGNSAAEPASADRILTRIAGLQPRPGERCLVFITSHGKEDEGVWLAYSREVLTPGELATALARGCARAPTVVIVSSCYSGAFARLRAPNRIVLTAARADRPSFGCQADRTYTVFDECLLGALPRAATWRAVFGDSLACVREREQRLHVLPSQPQAAFGKTVRDLPVR